MKRPVKIAFTQFRIEVLKDRMSKKKYGNNGTEEIFIIPNYILTLRRRALTRGPISK